ncbi:MAG: nuclear transport factor 2 family protein [Psychroflexus sp.]
MKLFFQILLIFCFAIASQAQTKKSQINQVIDAWHEAAAEADFETYFGLMTENSHFIGTDASENWTYEEFKSFSKPYFDKGKAWTFSPLERNIYLNSAKNMAWFDELLNSNHMEICRGSGVLVLKNNTWKIQHYVLSIAVPNELVERLNKSKSEHDKKFIINQEN